MDIQLHTWEIEENLQTETEERGGNILVIEHLK